MLAEWKNRVLVGNAALLLPVKNTGWSNLWTPATLVTHSLWKSSPKPPPNNKHGVHFRQHFHISHPINPVWKVAVLLTNFKDEERDWSIDRPIWPQSPSLWKIHLRFTCRFTAPEPCVLSTQPHCVLHRHPLFFWGLGGNLEPRALLLLKTCFRDF